MKFNGDISISRDSRDRINIRIEDDVSGIRFLDVNMSLQDFAFAVTGLSNQPITGELRGLEYLGKKKIMENRQVLAPKGLSGKAEQEQWLVDNCQEKGWLLNKYLGSQTSTQYDFNEEAYKLNYSVYKYVEVSE